MEDENRRVERALEHLSRQYLFDPEVSLIDYGEVLGAGAEVRNPRLALRIHVRHLTPHTISRFPDEVDGIPVVVMAANYGLQPAPGQGSGG